MNWLTAVGALVFGIPFFLYLYVRIAFMAYYSARRDYELFLEAMLRHGTNTRRQDEDTTP